MVCCVVIKCPTLIAGVLKKVAKNALLYEAQCGAINMQQVLVVNMYMLKLKQKKVRQEKQANKQ